MTTPTTLDQLAELHRNVELPELVQLLERQRMATHDIVVGSGNVQPTQYLGLHVADDTWTDPDSQLHAGVGSYRLTHHAEGQLASRLAVPPRWLRTMRERHADLAVHLGTLTEADADEQRTDEAEHVRTLRDAQAELWADTVATQLRDRAGSHLLRTFVSPGTFLPPTDPNHEPGIVRAVLSDRYRFLDNLDIVVAALEGVRDAGVDGATVAGCDLTDTSLHLRLRVPTVAVEWQQGLANYRSPYDSRSGDQLPVVEAGLVIRNSEVGSGAFSITPRMVVRICSNGMTVAKEAMREVHAGKRLEAGAVEASSRTLQAQRELVVAQVQDACAAFLTTDYVQRQLDLVADAAAVQLDQPVGVIEQVATDVGITAAEREQVLTLFMRSGDLSAGGVGHAVTALAQQVQDPERADELEGMWLPATQRAAVLATQ